MTYEAIVKKFKTALEKADASAISEHIAVQFNISGEGEGAFYLEIADGKASVEPYEYYDRDIVVYSEAKAALEFAAGKTTLIQAMKDGKLSIEGNFGKAELLEGIVFKKAAKETVKKTASKAKTTAKKTATVAKKATKATAKKVEDTKPVVEKTVKEVAKKTEKAAKTVAKKTETTAKAVAKKTETTAKAVAKKTETTAKTVVKKTEDTAKKTSKKVSEKKAATKTK